MDINTHPFAILCYIAIIIGIFACIHVIRSYWEWKTAHSWPHTNGEVIDSKVALYFTGSSEGSPGEERYNVQVTYKYNIIDHEYTCKRMSLTSQTMTCQYESTAKILQKQHYAIGQPVTVYYNPKKPQSATLDKSVNNKVLLLVFLGGLILPTFSIAAYGGLFAAKKSLIANISDPLLGLSILLFIGICYVALQVPGERLLDKDFEE